jgi:hypothetical protein
MIDKLKSCPFCGGKVEFEIYLFQSNAIVCHYCHVKLKRHREEEAVRNWNMRFGK